MYTNAHQKCLLESYKKELESKKFELVALKATIPQNKDSLRSSTEEAVNRENTLERELRMVCLVLGPLSKTGFPLYPPCTNRPPFPLLSSTPHPGY